MATRNLVCLLLSVSLLLPGGLALSLLSQSAFVLQIDEKRPAGASVGSIRNLLRRDMTVEELNNVTVDLYYTKDQSKLSLIPLRMSRTDSSLLVTTERIDRDQLCQSRGLCCDASMRHLGPEYRVPVCELNFLVTASSRVSGKLVSPELTVLIADLNDHRPRFKLPRYSLQFLETNRTGESVPLELAEDADWGRNAVVDYRLREHSGVFELRITRDADARWNGYRVQKLELVNLQPLDRESRSWHQLHLIAEDGDGNATTVALNVSVADVNDCRPEFVNISGTEVSIREDSRLNADLFSVLALDKDDGANARVKYRLAQRDSPFMVNQYTGQVSLIRRLRYVKGGSNKLDLTIVAFDNGNPSLSSEILLKVTVVDVNDHSPDIEVRGQGVGPNSIIRVRENVQYTSDKTLGFVHASDKDDGTNGVAECFLHGSETGRGGDFGLQSKQRLTSQGGLIYHLYASTNFDREAASHHNVMVVCRDGGEPTPRSSSVEVRIIVDDINDNPPVWLQPSYTFKLRENSPPGAQLGFVRADDADATPNNIVRYRLEPEDSPDAVVHPRSGELTSRRAFDREVQDQLMLKVVAFNTEPPGYSATVEVKIDVIDENDNRPMVAEGTPRQITVPEDTPPGTTVLCINASDADKPDSHSMLKFSVVNDNNRGSGKFRIDHWGNLKLMFSLDREQESVHQLRIIVTDSGTPSLSSEFQLTVLVGDVNDTPPRFLFPDNMNDSCKVNISSTMAPGTDFAKIIAKDDDAGANGNVTYRLLGAASGAAAYFNLDPLSGLLRLARSLSPLVATGRRFFEFKLHLEAADQGQPKPLKRTSFIKICVLVGPDNSGVGFAGAGAAAAGARNHAADDRGTAGVGGRGGSGATPGVSSELSSLIVLLVASLAILVLLILILTVVFLFVKRRAELRNRRDASVAMKTDLPSYDHLGKLPAQLTLSSPDHQQIGVPLASLGKNRRLKIGQIDRQETAESAELMLAACGSSMQQQQQQQLEQPSQLMTEVSVSRKNLLTEFKRRSTDPNLQSQTESGHSAQSADNLLLSAQAIKPGTSLTMKRLQQQQQQSYPSAFRYQDPQTSGCRSQQAENYSVHQLPASATISNRPYMASKHHHYTELLSNLTANQQQQQQQPGSHVRPPYDHISDV